MRMSFPDPVHSYGHRSSKTRRSVLNLRTRLPARTSVIEKVAHIHASSERPLALDCPNHLNVQCRAGQFPDGQDDAIMRLIYEESDGTYACSGTLLNDTGETFEPYILTARHCINTAAAAASVSARWFYQTRSLWQHSNRSTRDDDARWGRICSK